MQKAIAAVEKHGDSYGVYTSEKYGIPRSTLHDHTSGKIEHGAKLGRGAYLTSEEEEELVSFLIKCAGIGYPHTRKQISTCPRDYKSKGNRNYDIRWVVGTFQATSF